MGTYNIKFPIVDDNITNTFFELTKVTKDAYTSDLMLLLLTQKGERYYEPDYGTDLEKFIFEPNDGITSSDVINDIKNTVALYLPNISIKNVTFKRSDTDPTMDENQLTVNIDFVYTEDSFSQKDTLELKF